MGLSEMGFTLDRKVSTVMIFGLVALLLSTFSWLAWLSLVLLLLFMALVYTLQFTERRSKTRLNLLIWPCVVVCGFLLAVYRPEGFTYPVVFSANQLHEAGKPFTLSVNVAKLLAGWFVIVAYGCISIFYFNRRLAVELVSVVIIGLIINGFAIWLLDLSFYLKNWLFVAQFAVINLLATCVAEEAFLRVLIQQRIMHWCRNLPKSVAFWLPLIISAGVFILVHGKLSGNQTLVYGLAGFCYGLIYSLTGRVWLSIALHGTVNLMHFSFLTYPIL